MKYLHLLFGYQQGEMIERVYANAPDDFHQVLITEGIAIDDKHAIDIWTDLEEKHIYSPNY